MAITILAAAVSWKVVPFPWDYAKTFQCYIVCWVIVHKIVGDCQCVGYNSPTCLLSIPVRWWAFNWVERCNARHLGEEKVGLARRVCKDKGWSGGHVRCLVWLFQEWLSLHYAYLKLIAVAWWWRWSFKWELSTATLGRLKTSSWNRGYSSWLQREYASQRSCTLVTLNSCTLEHCVTEGLVAQNQEAHGEDEGPSRGKE